MANPQVKYADDVAAMIATELTDASKLHNYFKSKGLSPAEGIDVINYAKFNKFKPEAVPRDIPIIGKIFPKLVVKDPVTSGYLERSAKEYDAFTKALAKRKRLALGAAAALLAGAGAYNFLKDDETDAHPMQRMYDIPGFVRKSSALEAIAVLSVTD